KVAVFDTASENGDTGKAKLRYLYGGSNTATILKSSSSDPGPLMCRDVLLPPAKEGMGIISVADVVQSTTQEQTMGCMDSEFSFPAQAGEMQDDNFEIPKFHQKK
ncbi:unnamed protein product, partial [Dovyalis caffra]